MLAGACSIDPWAAEGGDLLSSEFVQDYFTPGFQAMFDEQVGRKVVPFERKSITFGVTLYLSARLRSFACFGSRESV